MLRTTANGSKRVLSLFSPPTVAALAGAGLSVTGLHMLYPPLAYIVPGVSLLAFAAWWVAPLGRGRR
jgi:hypothetical protein